MKGAIPKLSSLTDRLFAEKWRPFFLKNSLSDSDLLHPGVYLLAYSNKNLQNRRVNSKEVFYVGMTCSGGGLKQRLRQFLRGIEKNSYHSAARRFFREFSKRKPYSKLKNPKRFYFAALPFNCISDKGKAIPSDFVQLGHICAVEYYAIARVYERAGKKPPLNKLGKRPAL